ncbi:MAG: UDP-N-acetylmuramate dehydrogenase [Alphaproteobacteria bacterium]|nr:UDP-N-acetylmuramate dehydrogenase [Alphaproteobacteria bacterium]
MTFECEKQIIDSLPLVEGRYSFNQKMSQTTWFKVGGPAEVFFKPAHAQDLSHFLKNKPSDMDILCMGAGSNVLVRDHGIKGCVVRLGSGFSGIEIDGPDIIVGAGCLDRTVVMKCLEEGISGLEFLVGVPGTIGGAIAMNAGAYGSEVKDFLRWVELMDEKGEIYRLSSSELSMNYRDGNLPEGSIALRAAFGCYKETQQVIKNKIDDFLKKREDSQPIKGRTGGSTFKNPEGYKAWELIDKAGCRGLRIGDAAVSEKHCNFLLNLDSATARDLEDLGETVRRKVKETSNIHLEWEILRLGM